MHFQHPELLYALFLLLIPLIVHLFRLRKFQKEDFTNVKFLKKVIQETRKSSRLKKFLILFTRLLLVACLVLAFAQPFIPASEKAMTEVKTLIYLDNSFSQQAGNGDNSVFRKAVNQLLESLDNAGEYSLITNSNEYLERQASELKAELQNIDFSPEVLDFRAIRLKAENYFSKYPQAEKDFILISDFQKSMNFPTHIEQTEVDYTLIKNRPENLINISLDTAFIKSSTPENIEIMIRVSASGISEKNITLSIKNGERLLGRNTLKFNDNTIQEISFRLPNELTPNGVIEIENSGLRYDNQLFFNIAERTPIHTVIVSDADEDFLSRIYTEPEFNVNIFKPSQIDFNELNSANLVILNEVNLISPSLLNNLDNLKKDGTSIVIIPPREANAYSPALNRLGLPALRTKIETRRLITGIDFDHPFLSGVFEDRTENFEYPRVATSHNVSTSGGILNFEDNQPFLLKRDNIFLFTAALNSENSNFKNSPLIVPIFYQFGLQSLRENQLYYETTTATTIDIPVNLGNDEVLHLVNSEIDLIPQQQNFSNRVEINTSNLSLDAGNYSIASGQNNVGNLSFNHDRRESNLEYMNLSEIDNVKIYDSVTEYFSESNAATQTTALWKWFVIFALIFLAIEMLLIKFFK